MTRDELTRLLAEAGPARPRLDDFEPTQEHYAKAIDWLLTLRERDLSSCAEFEIWKKDPVNEFAFNDIEALFARSARPAQDARYFVGRPSTSWPRRSNLTIAAASCLFLVVAWPWIESLRYLGADAAASIGEVKTVTLEDGTQVTLNTRAAIDTDIGQSARSARLRDGEAYFEVARDESRPFLVRAGKANVRVLGTQFNVRIDGDQTRISVDHGRVRVTSVDRPDEPVYVTDGQEALVTAKAIQTQPMSGRMDAWRMHRIAFAYTPLRLVVRDLNRYRDHSIYIANDAVGDNLVSGVFETNDPEEAIRIIERTLGVKSVTLPTGQTILY